MCNAEEALEDLEARLDSIIAEARTEALAKAERVIDQALELAADVDRGILTAAEMCEQLRMIGNRRSLAGTAAASTAGAIA